MVDKEGVILIDGDVVIETVATADEAMEAVAEAVMEAVIRAAIRVAM